MEGENRARFLIGTQAPDDWKLEPHAHGAALPPEAGALKRILARAQVQDLMARYVRADHAAMRAQARYKRLGRLAIIMHAAAAIVGLSATWLLANNLSAALPAPIESWGTQTDVALAVQYVFIVIAIGSAQLLLMLKPFDKWMKERAAAETARIELFHYVVAQDEPVRSGELSLLPLQLEYFRRYQLEVQQNYYGGRGGQHARAAGQLASRRSLYGSLLAITGAPAIYFGLRVAPLGAFGAALAKTALVFIAAAVPILLSANRAFSLLSQHDRDASRYQQTHDNLRHLSDHYLEAARAAAQAGDRAGVLSFADAVNDQISSEHREWISLADDALHHDFETIAARRLPTLRKS